MRKIRLNKKILFLGCAILVIIATIFLYNKVLIISETINLILISGIIAYVLKPLRDLIMRCFNLSKRISSLLILISLSLFIVLFTVITIPKLIDEMGHIGEIFETLNTYFMQMEEKLKLTNNSVVTTVYEEMSNKVWAFLVALSYKSLDCVIEISKNIISYIIVPIIAYYFLSDGEKISNTFYMIIPINKRELLRKISKDINVLLQRYVVSQLVLCLITTVLSFTFFGAVGLKFAFILALINGVFNIVPYFGVLFGAIPAVFVAFIESPNLAIWTIVGIFVIQQIEGNLIAPKITADSTDFHPMLIILLLIIGEKLGGVVGMIFIIPIAVIIKVLYEDINYYIF
ncbi:MAG: AI-2E family transporter [Clostridium sp.]|uniref:AI-2E family transporter n=1 Tax=Clostridium sp. TaxID=1506 RepID=UPI003F34738F